MACPRAVGLCTIEPTPISEVPIIPAAIQEEQTCPELMAIVRVSIGGVRLECTIERVSASYAKQFFLGNPPSRRRSNRPWYRYENVLLVVQEEVRQQFC